MLHQFNEFIKNRHLVIDGQKVLLAVSGGIDSMVMLNLFHRSGIPIAIVHCNFKLRGKESDDDEQFVIQKAKEIEVPVHYKSFQTEKYAIENKISIQMAARDLRYAWFEEKRKELDFDRVAIAHNADDVNETFLANLTRGTGIKGLTGIKEITENIIRPVLFANRKEIEEYAQANKIIYREDSSNASIKYYRNYIRHELIPAFEKINPEFKTGLRETIQHLDDANVIFNIEISKRFKQLAIYKDNDLYLPLKELKKLPALKTYLFEFLRPFGFSNDSLNNLIAHLKSQAGKKFYSTSHLLLKDRDFLIVSEIKEISNANYLIYKTSKVITQPIHLEFGIIQKEEEFTPDKNEHIAQLDYSLLKFPLTLRKWKKGDAFIPLGMNKKKKLSDFFIDRKLSLIQKENIWLLCSNDKIVWIIGQRTDELFKISNKTRQMLQVKYYPE